MSLEVDAEFFGKEARVWNDASTQTEMQLLQHSMAWPGIFRGEFADSSWRAYGDMLQALNNTISKLSETSYTTANTLRASARAYLENENASVEEINRLSTEYGL